MAGWIWAVAVLAAAPGALQGQGRWFPGARAGAFVPLEGDYRGPGLELEAFLARRQTPGVEIAGGAGVRWIPTRETVFRFDAPEGGEVVETRSEGAAGPTLSLAAARRVPAGRFELLLQAEVGVGLLRERTTSSSDRPGIARPLDLTDWEVTPTWEAGATLRLPGWSSVGLRPELDARLTAITLAGDGFVPGLSLALGLGRPPE